jgi:hypothetical protein
MISAASCGAIAWSILYSRRDMIELCEVGSLTRWTGN